MRISRELCRSLALCVGLIFAGCSQGPADTPKQLSKQAGFPGTAPQSDQSFKFVVMSDRCGGHVPGLWEQAIEEVNLLQPDFVLCVGDLIEGYSKDPNIINAMWDELDGMTRKLDAPFLFCPGNHDTSNKVMNEIYIRRHGTAGKSYYSFNYRSSHFVILHINDGMWEPALLQEQLDWLAKDLQQAKDAQHVFVLYHKPLWDDKVWWPRLAKLLDPAKTTILNGHWHSQRYGVYDGIETIVVAATAALVGGHGGSPNRDKSGVRELGEFHLVAQVSVDGPKVTTALLTLGEIQPKDVVQQAFVEKMGVLADANQVFSVSSQGGPLTVKLVNPFPTPVKVSLSLEAEDWTSNIPSAEITIEANQTIQKVFELKPTVEGAVSPTLAFEFNLTTPAGKDFVMRRTAKVAMPVSLDIPIIKGLNLESDEESWAKVKPIKLRKGNLFRDPNLWGGPKDYAPDLRIATDGETLFLRADVVDDQVAVDANQSFNNDALELYWDAREPAKRDGKHALGTGQVILPLGATAGPIAPQWYVDKRPQPKGLIAKSTMRPDGYTYLVSIPLGELGCKTPVQSGQSILFEAQFDDRDLVKGKAKITGMSIGGQGALYASPKDYATCTFK